MSFGLEVLDRIDVQGNPVNGVDPWGLAYDGFWDRLVDSSCKRTTFFFHTGTI